MIVRTNTTELQTFSHVASKGEPPFSTHATTKNYYAPMKH